MSAIEKKRSKLRLIRSQRCSTAAKRRKIWQNGELERFKLFLQDNSTRLSIDEIAKLFHIPSLTVKIHQERLGVSLSREERMKLLYNVEKKRRGIQKLRRKLLKHHRQKEAARKKQLADLAKQYRERHPDTPEKECPTCQLSLPKSRLFFYFRDTRKGSFTYRKFDHYCKVCTSISRRQKRRKDRQHALRKARQSNDSPHKNPVD